MAAILAEARGDLLGIDVEARSAGTLGIVDKPADANAIYVCGEVGLDLRDHRSQGISEALIAWADRILVMELDQATHLRTYYPSVGDKLLLLGPFGGVGDIADPRGGWAWRFRRTRRLLETCIDGLLRRLQSR
jgi:protein-tyrosine-phosphatase